MMLRKQLNLAIMMMMMLESSLTVVEKVLLPFFIFPSRISQKWGRIDNNEVTGQMWEKVWAHCDDELGMAVVLMLLLLDK